MLASAARAFEPESLPEAAIATHDTREAPASLSLPVGTYDGTLPMLEVEGALHTRAWRIPSTTLSSLRIVQGLRVDLAEAGYEIILDCDTQACGGFDFRFGLTVLPAPEMNVDLFDFRVITAERENARGPEYVYLLVSRGRSNRFVQLMELVTATAGTAPTSDAAPTPDAAPVPSRGPDAPRTPPASGASPDDRVPVLIGALTTSGHVVLSDLDFASGAGALSDRSYPSLEALAEYLKGNPARVIAVVGHTDSVGSLEANVALSKRRAEAVRARLVTRYGVPGAQVQAQGAGYMAPVASNLTAEGREANRRVEAVLLSGE
ncbi:OmpA family protein [Pseudooceanicola sp.]